MKYLYKICGKISLLCYIPMIYQLWHLCHYGSVRRHFHALAFWAVCCIVTFLLWLTARHFCKKNAPQKRKKSGLFYGELLAFVAVTLIFVGGIIYSGIPYHGAFSWKIEDLCSRRQVPLKHGNFLEDGVEGILSDLDSKLHLPEELYIAQTFQVRFDAEGKIQKIDAFLYGKNRSGRMRTYLVDYHAGKEERINVWLGDDSSEECEEDKALLPLISILEKSQWQETVAAWAESDPDQQYEIYYAGRRAFDVQDGLRYLPGDADGDGTDTGSDCISELWNGGQVVGYEVSLHIPASESITPVRYIMEPSYIPQQEIEENLRDQLIEQAKEKNGWTVDQQDGSMYFFLDDSKGWRLCVQDAAAGSCFYILEQTEDGGTSWNLCNEDPFSGWDGVAEGLCFYDENIGIAGLTGPSQSASGMYLTKDGGKTFREILLPMDQVTSLPDTAAEYGFMIEDYDYLNMPEINGDVLTITVTSAALESDGILFSSEDNGDTWTYQGVTK